MSLDKIKRRVVMPIQSRTTPGHKMQLRAFVAETLFIRQHGKLPPYFWQQTRYKFRDGMEIKAASKFIKIYGEAILMIVVLNNRELTTLTDYAKAEVYLQQEKNRRELRKLAKDVTAPEHIKKIGVEDLRTNVTKRPMGLFSKLEKLNGQE
jgi:hypothetical protein